MAASSAFMESFLDPVGGWGEAPACLLQLPRGECQKRVSMIERAKRAVLP
jgi:hypothetical protein